MKKKLRADPQDRLINALQRKSHMRVVLQELVSHNVLRKQERKPKRNLNGTSPRQAAIRRKSLPKTVWPLKLQQRFLRTMQNYVECTAKSLSKLFWKRRHCAR